MRINKSLKNIFFGIGGLIITTFFSFITRTFFVNYLGEIYLGLSGVFSNILVILSLAELGIGSSIIYYLYKPLANDNKEKIAEIMNFYSFCYKFIGITIAIIGSLIIPFLKSIVGQDIDNLVFLYILTLSNTIVSYMFFSYKRSLLIADQKMYLVSAISNIFIIVMYIAQIITIYVYKSFEIYLIIQVVFTILQNIAIGLLCNYKYAYLKKFKNRKLNQKDKKNIFKNIKSIFLNRLSWAIVIASDNLVISQVMGLRYVGLYSNYSLIIMSIERIVFIIFNSIKDSIGNLNVLEKKEKKMDVFNEIFFVSYWIYGVASICTLILVNDFIKIWIGERYLLDIYILISIVITFYVTGLQISTTLYRETMGLFNHYKYIPLMAVFINLGLSIILGKIIGLIGIMIGTIISKLLTQFWIDPYVVFKYGFEDNNYYKYFIKYIKYLGKVLIIGISVFIITKFILINSFSGFILKGIIVFSLSNIFIFILSFKDREFIYLKKILLEKISGIKIKIKK